MILHAIAASLALGAVMTFGDWIWAFLNLRHRMAYGLAHGAVMCLCLGTAIGLREGRALAGAAAGPLVGVAAAAAFYALAPWLRLGAMFPAWMLFWVLFAILQAVFRKRLRPERGAQSPRESERGWGPASAEKRWYGRATATGLIAAVLSGAAFYAISGIWTRHDPGGPNYLWNFLAWSFAFFPGFAALFWGQAVNRESGSGRES